MSEIEKMERDPSCEQVENKSLEDQLAQLKKVCQSCQKCPLAKTRTQIVFSGGNPRAKIMLIGEAPGFNEDQTGTPFVGKAGQLLDKIFASVQLTREKDVYICNTIKCRPPDNRNPSTEEKAACRAYLDQQIQLIHPDIILLCGKVALTAFLPNETSITRVRGQWFKGPFGAQMMPIFHPSYLLRNQSHAVGSPKYYMWQDIREIKRVYDQLTARE